MALLQGGRSLSSVLIFTWGASSAALTWDDCAASQDKERAPAKLTEQQLNMLWSDLGCDDAAKAYQAILGLTAAHRQSVALLRQRLHPVQPIDPEKLAQLLKSLRSERFAERQKATEELARLGDLAALALENELHDKPSLELRRRVEQLRQKLEGPVTQPEQLRGIRALEVLEHIGSEEAQQLLRAVAAGAPGARLTREARSSLERLKRRAKP